MVRAVLAGCGLMGRRWLTAAAEVGSVEIVGLVDIDPARALALRDEAGPATAAVGSDLAAMLAATRADVLFDVVVPAARRRVAATGFAAGCHVLSEKPMAPSLREARDLLALARKTGRIHAIVQNRRYVPGVRRLRRFVESGAIGALTSLHCDFFVAPHFGGFREAMDHVLLLDMAIHTFDAARYVAGAAPRAVYCLERNPAGSWYADGAAANALFEFDGGIVFDYRGSWCAEGLRTSWESRWRVVGTQGSLAWDGADHFEAERVTGERTGILSTVEPVEVPGLDPRDAADGHVGVIRDFIAAVEGGSAPETVATDNILSLEMVFAAIRSAETRRRVTLPLTTRRQS